MSDTSEHDDSNWKPSSNRWLIAVVVTLAAFMEVLDTTIVNVSLPHIAGTVGASYDQATWTLTSYLVANGIVLPISGWLGRLIGRKRYFLICVGMFTVCSFLCGISNSLGELVVFRLLQGFFGGGLQPNQQSIILDTFEPAQRGRAFAVVAVATIVAPVIGPTLGGWITDHYSWRWVFLINVPVGVLTVLAIARLVEDPPWVVREHEKGDRSVDYIGLGLIALGLGSLQVMMDRGEDWDWFGSSAITLLAFVALIGIVGAVGWLLYAKKPVVDLRVFKDRNFAVGTLLIFGVGAILYSSAVLIPQLAQQQLGYTAFLAGLILSPGALMIVILIPIVGKVLLPNVQTRYVIAFGFFAMGCALLYCMQLTPNPDFWTLVAMRAAQTFGLAFMFVPITTIAFTTIPKELNGDASALFTMARNVAGAICISLATALVTERTQVHRSYLSGHLTPLNQNYQDLVLQYQQTFREFGQSLDGVTGSINKLLTSQATILAYIDVFWYCAIASFIIVPFAFLLRPGKAEGGAGAGGA